jgi:hypothetical protein
VAAARRALGIGGTALPPPLARRARTP